MTVTSTVNRNDYVGNGVTVLFPVTFRFLANTHLRVLRTIIATNVTTELILDSLGPNGFSVTGAGQPNGGQITVVTAPANGTERLSILRNVPITQETDYIANDAFPAESHERGLDKLTMILGQQGEVVARAVVLSPQTTGVSNELPGPAALNLLRWKADLTGLENAAPPAIATVADGAVVDATVSPIAGIQGTKVVFQQAGTGAVLRTVQDRQRDRVSVFDFLTDAQKNDVRARTFLLDVTAGVQACIDYATTNGRCAYFPGGGYLVGKLTLNEGAHLNGESAFKTELRLKAATNDNLLYGANSDALWGTNTDAGIRLWSVTSMTLNGNRAANSTGSCLAVYGRSYVVRDVKIVNAPEYGMRTEYYSFGGATPGDFGMEAHFENITIDTSGKHGWWNKGPHDSVAINIVIIDSSQTADNTYDNFHIETTARFYACHGWTRGTTLNLPSYSWADLVGGCEAANCHFEGTKTAPALLAGQRSSYTECTIYAAKGGRTVIIRAPGVRLTGYLLGKSSGGDPATVGVTLGLAGADNVQNCTINLQADLQDGGVVDFTNSQGNNHLTIRGNNPSGALVVGSPSSSDFCDISINGASGVNIQQQYPTNFRTGLNRYSTQSGITAAGATQGTATLLTATINNVTTVAAATGVRLPDDTAGTGYWVWVHNFGANNLNVYPDSGSRINNGAFDAAVVLAPNTGAHFGLVALAQWLQR